MKHIFQKYLDKFIVAIVFLFVVIPTFASTKIGDLYYNLDSYTHTAEVTYYSYSSSSNQNYVSGDLIIPESVTYNSQTYSVASIGNNAFYGCSALTSITIPNSVTSIGYSTFDGCTSLAELTLEDGDSTLELGYNSSSKNGLFSSCPLEKIYLGRNLSYSTYSYDGYSPFANQTNLTDVTIGNQVTNLGSYLFYKCSTLTSITIPNSVTSIENDAFDRCTSLAELTIEDGDKILELGFNSISYNGLLSGLFSSCPLEKIYLGRNLSYPSGTSYYRHPPFENLKNLTDVTIGNQVTNLGEYLFNGCIALKSITIPNSVTSIGISAFSGCSALTSITIPGSVTSIGNSAFDGCTSLAELTMEDGESTLKLGDNSSSNGLFSSCPLEKIYLGRDLSYYSGYSGGYAPFANQKKLKDVSIGNQVTGIGRHLFYKCSALTNITIPNSVTSIEDYAFYGCSALTGITIPNSVTSIGDYSFYECSSITTVTLGNSVTSIGHYAFSDCTNIESIFYNPGDSFIKINSDFNIFADVYSTANLFILNSPEKTLDILDTEDWSKFNHIFYLQDDKKYVPSRWMTSPVSVQNVLYNDNRGFLSESGKEVILNSNDNIASAYWSEGDFLEQLTSSPGFSFIPYSNWRLNSFYVSSESELFKIVTLPSAGELFNSLGLQDIQRVISLKITGEINGTDVMTLNRMNQLKVLDLSDVKIVEGGQTYRDNLKTATDVFGSYFLSECKNLEFLILPATAKSIDSYALSSNKLLRFISIPASVTEICDLAFYGSSSLFGLILEDGSSTLKLGYNPGSGSYYDYSTGLFSSCPLEKIYLGRNLSYSTGSSDGYSPFANQTNLTDVTIGNQVRNLGSYLFYDCSSLTDITIPNSVTSIGYEAFYKCSALTSITIPNSVTSIRDYAFDGCKGLTAVYISDLEAWCKITFFRSTSNPLYYAHHLFLNEDELNDLIVPSSFTTINDYSFIGCNSLKSVTIHNSVTSIGSSAFSGCSALTNITIPNSVTSIESYTFDGCSALNNIIIPNSISSIGSSAFRDCSALNNITIPNSVTSIEDYTFYGCSALKNIIIPNSISSIGSSTFYGCSALNNITIPNSVSSIGYNAFDGCTSLAELTIEDGDSTLELGYNSYTCLFSSCPLEKIYLGRNLSYSSATSYRCSPFATLKNLTDVTIGNHVTNLGEYLFYGCNALLNITIPDSVTSIGDEAFSGCSSLETVTLGPNLKSIGNSGFNGCTNLSKIYSLNPTPPEINNDTFDGVNKETCQLVVTKGNLVHYWLDPVWKEFLNISDDLLYLSTLPSVKYGDAPVNLADYAPEGYSFVYETSNSDVARLDGSILTIVGAGEATIGASYQQSGTPMEVMGQMRQFVVNKAELSIGVEDVTIVYGEEIPQFTLTMEGLVYDETLEDIGELPVAYTDATEGSAPGVYPIFLTGGESRNYNLKLSPGTLTIIESGLNNIEEIMDDIFPDGENSLVRIFNMDGIMIYDGHEAEMKLKELKKGIYIVVKGNSSRKILIR